jgi:hypothetical protein
LVFLTLNFQVELLNLDKMGGVNDEQKKQEIECEEGENQDFYQL